MDNSKETRGWYVLPVLRPVTNPAAFPAAAPVIAPETCIHGMLEIDCDVCFAPPTEESANE